MRKIVFLSSLFLILLLAISTPVSATLTKQVKIPTIIKGTTESIQKVIDALISKTDNHEARIVELEKKIKALEEKVIKLEAKSVGNDGINNTQQSQILKEDTGVISQPDSSLNQKLDEFLGTSSNHLSADDFVISNAPEIKDLGEIKLK